METSSLPGSRRPQPPSAGFTVWFTGLPCAGKTTLARGLERHLLGGAQGVLMLDGDEVRRRLSKGLGYTKEDRDENVRRIGFVAGAITKVGGIAIVSAVSPYRAIRDECRREIGRFVEVFVDCRLEDCIGRDVKGHYRKALAGEIKNFTGITDPYEPPTSPEITVNTSSLSTEEALEKVFQELESLGYLLKKSPNP